MAPLANKLSVTVGMGELMSGERVPGKLMSAEMQWKWEARTKCEINLANALEDELDKWWVCCAFLPQDSIKAGKAGGLQKNIQLYGEM